MSDHGKRFKETRVAEPSSARSEVRKDRPVLIVTAGGDVGRVYSLAPAQVATIGRSDDCLIRFDDDSLSREHAKVTVLGPSNILQDEDSTNGTFVNERKIGGAHILVDGDRISFGEGHAVLRFNVVSAEEETQLRAVWESTRKDGLTGLLNRRNLETLLDQSIERARDEGADLAVAMIDIDHFKRVNDTWGHPAGDEVIREVARRVAANVRADDECARYGGEEITVVLPELDARAAADVVAKVHAAIGDAPIAIGEGKTVSITASCGVASLSECTSKDKPSLLGRADARLYAAKQGGRNRVVSAG